MKRWYVCLLVFALATVFLAVGVAAEDYLCEEDQDKMFAMSKLMNAHVEDWDAGNYIREVCYTDYFEGELPGTFDPHLCLPGNTNAIIRSSGSTNAHVESKEGTAPEYGPICYGDLECFVQEQGKMCNEEPGDDSYSRIISIDELTNTHGFFTDVATYLVCCKSPSFDSICDYDGECEPPETEQNCPDCESDCGDGLIEGIEQCDCGSDWDCTPGELDNKDCTNYVPESPYISGDLECVNPDVDPDNGCTFDDGYCNLAECSDEEDNDEDQPDMVFADEDDFSCYVDGVYDPSHNDESEPEADCQDGEDNDEDGTCDWNGCQGMPPDEGCEDSQDDNEVMCGDDNIDEDFGEECDCGIDGVCEPGDFLGGSELCEDWDEDYHGGTLGCDPGLCEVTDDNCEGYPGFCIAEEPFLIGTDEGAFVSPSSCQDYNWVYPYEENASKREELCRQDCVPGASDPVNNGAGGLSLEDWGCRWDADAGEPDTHIEGGACKFFYNETGSGDRACWLEYEILEDCGEDNPFRLVRVESSKVDPSVPGNFCDDAGCGASECETQIMCPRVIQLPLMGAFGLALSVVIISLIYAYINRKK